MSFASFITLKMILQQITVWQRKLKHSNFVAESARISSTSDKKWPMKHLSKVRNVQRCNESLISPQSVVIQ